MTPALRAAAIATAVLIGLGGCSLWGMEGGPGAAGASVPAARPGAAPVDAVLGPDGVQRVEITVGDDLRLRPAAVRARPGVIELTFRNGGAIPHDLELPSAAPAAPSAGAGPSATSAPSAGPATSTTPAPNAGTGAGTGNLNGGASATVRVRVERPGSYPIPCLYHVSSGMQGTLLVVAATG